MIRFKSNRKAFVITALIILLCLISLAGATVALFTSDTHDGTIGVITTAGNMDVDIVDATSAEPVSLEGQVLKFENVPEGEDAIFEPGATFYTQAFQVLNAGNIPINFRLYISKDDQMDMESFQKAFEFGITTDPNDPDSIVWLTSFEGRLETDERSAPYYLVVRMKETANNDFQNERYSGIGITVYAVQGNVSVQEEISNE